jgi:hypothetical protein
LRDHHIPPYKKREESNKRIWDLREKRHKGVEEGDKAILESLYYLFEGTTRSRKTNRPGTSHEADKQEATGPNVAQKGIPIVIEIVWCEQLFTAEKVFHSFGASLHVTHAGHHTTS